MTQENFSFKRNTNNCDVYNQENIPVLRFPEFSGEWKTYYYSQLSESISSGKSHSKETKDGEYNYYGSVGLIGHCSNYTYNDELLIIARVGANTGDVYLIEKQPCNISDNTIIIKHKEKLVNYTFSLNYLKTYNFKRIIIGSGRPLITSKDVKKIEVKIPSIKEQEKIASFLSAIDKKIALMEEKLNCCMKYHHYIIQQLCINSCNSYVRDGWDYVFLKDILFEHKCKSSGNEEVFSVSVEKGLINQIEHLGRSFSAKNTDNYNLVKYGDIVYTKSPTGDFPLGIIKQSHNKKDVIVSPLYGVFTPKSYELGYILENYFKYPVNCHNYLHSIVQRGAKNTMNISNKTFLSKKLYIPLNKDIQRKIFNVLSTLNNKIENTSLNIKELYKFKKGLLQKMFC